MRKMIATGAAAALVGAAGLAVAEPAAAAKKYTACVKKSSGEMRLLLGKSKKCKKGWKKTTWTKAGPTGSKGPGGPGGAANSFGYVVDAKGVVVGQALGSFSLPIPVFMVSIDGGQYVYYPNGWLVGPTSVYYDNAACTGTPFTVASDALERDWILQDTGLRAVQRTLEPTLGPASAFKPDGTASSVLNLSRWWLNQSGVCTADMSFTGYRLPLTSVPAPPDHPGPLRLV